MNTLKGLIFLLAIVILASCDDDESNVTLFSKSWRPSLTDKNPKSNPVPPLYSADQQVVYANWLNCEQDDIFKFHKNGLLVITHKGISCDEETEATTTIPFIYNAEAGTLVMEGVTFTINEVSDKQLKYSTTISSASGINPYVFILK